ncbi:TGFB1I1 [Branchiostoma lanceolatum]|uniref:TGFB1I1 protein n=2 Tax=Branchiostoma lanceolatum TaxID=7740 RepID=A0A8K0ELM5_BRALA|nr:TGFB1I1 [Branchiostoma lanceolatum]
MSSLSDQIRPQGNSEPDVRMLNGPLAVIPKSHSASKLRKDRDFWAKLEEKEKAREIQAARQRLQKDLQQNRDIYNHGYFKISPPHGVVTFVAVQVKNVATIWESNSADTVIRAMNRYSDIVRRATRDFRGYEVEAEEESFLVAFQQPLDAVNWSLTVQLAMTDTKWEEELLTCDDCIRVFKSHENGYDVPRLIFCGPRLQMGISKGRVDSVYHYASGHMGYRGTEVYRTRGICRLAQGGQILLNESLWQDLPKDQIAPYVHREVGSFKLEGFDNLTSLTEVLPCALEERARWFGIICAECNKLIKPKEGYVKALGSNWHTDHFRCWQCKKVLNGTYIVKDQKPYCEEDFFQYNAPRCRACGDPITGGFIEALESTWHPDCFVCQRCHKAPTKDDNIFEFNALPYCTECYSTVTYGTT